MPDATPPLPYLEVINSFAIRRTQQFFLIGRLHGVAEPGMFAWIQLNRSLDMTVRIKAIEEVEFPKEPQPYTLLELHEPASPPEYLDFMLAFNVGLETVRISADGTD